MAVPIQTNEEYYSGEKDFLLTGAQDTFTTTFNVELSTEEEGNFFVYKSVDNGVTWTDITSTVSAVANDNTISPPYLTNKVKINPGGVATNLIKIKLKAEAFRNNYGSYSYVTLDDVINNFLVTYVGAGKLI